MTRPDLRVLPALLHRGVAVKRCRRCEAVKPVEEFGKRPRARDGRYSYCNRCNQEQVRAWRDADPQRLRESRRRSNLRRRNGITRERYDEILQAQDGGCAICGAVPKVDQFLNVDHDHSCCPRRNTCGLCVRGLLCWECNIVLGKMVDDPERLRTAADYLERGHV